MRKLHDKFFRQAKREGKLARSVYKLEELDRREGLFRPGGKVLDLGASPGSWTEYILEAVGPGGVACAIDLKPIHRKFKGRAHFLLRDARELGDDDFARQAPDGFDALVSDMAPNTSGIRIVDQSRSLELCQCALTLARRRLRRGGNFVCKIFYGPETEAFRDSLPGFFQAVRLRKPLACRSASIEAYVVGVGFAGPEAG
ncbi:MAG: RlmE family RNA methyltransferase [Planctomycetota bacterium]|jgi:23S rRNA (uridine2552-2'-O)-methyltransferase|nr:RlmE family RNA methyltransferase [Planctomycetota bacterium]